MMNLFQCHESNLASTHDTSLTASGVCQDLGSGRVALGPLFSVLGIGLAPSGVYIFCLVSLDFNSGVDLIGLQMPLA